MKTAGIRKLRHADADSLRALYMESLRLNAAGFVQDPLFHGDIWMRAQDYMAQGGTMLGVFNADGILAGFGGLKPMTADTAQICNLHLHPDYQGLGLGKKLCLDLMQYARDAGLQSVELHVTATQSRAIGLYKCLGFVETDRKTYDINGASYDTIFMALHLDAVH